MAATDEWHKRMQRLNAGAAPQLTRVKNPTSVGATIVCGILIALAIKWALILAAVISLVVIAWKL